MVVVVAPEFITNLPVLVQDAAVQQYVSFICIFLIVYALTYRALHERLGRSAVAIGVALGALCTVSMAAVNRLSIVDIEPLVVLCVFGVVAIVIALAFRWLFGVGVASMAAIGWLALYSMVDVAAPSLLPVLGRVSVMPFALYLASVVYLIYAFSVAAFPNSKAPEWLGHSLRTLHDRPAAASRRLREVEQLDENLASVAEKESSSHAELAAELDETAKAVQHYRGDFESLRSVVGDRLQQIQKTEREVEAELQRFALMADRLHELSGDEFEDLRHSFIELPAEDRPEVTYALNELRKSLATDKVQANLAKAIAANNAAVRDALQRAQRALDAGDASGCQKALGEAKLTEHHAIKLVEQVRRFAQQLKSSAAHVISKAQAGQAVEAA